MIIFLFVTRYRNAYNREYIKFYLNIFNKRVKFFNSQIININFKSSLFRLEIKKYFQLTQFKYI